MEGEREGRANGRQMSESWTHVTRWKVAAIETCKKQKFVLKLPKTFCNHPVVSSYIVFRQVMLFLFYLFFVCCHFFLIDTSFSGRFACVGHDGFWWFLWRLVWDVGKLFILGWCSSSWTASPSELFSDQMTLWGNGRILSTQQLALRAPYSPVCDRQSHAAPVSWLDGEWTGRDCDFTLIFSPGNMISSVLYVPLLTPGSDSLEFIFLRTCFIACTAGDRGVSPYLTWLVLSDRTCIGVAIVGLNN